MSHSIQPGGYPADINNPDDWAAFLARYLENRATNTVHNGIGLVALHIVDAIRDARDQGQAAGWRPIETAPKDGTKVDLWVYGLWPSEGFSRIPDAWYDQHDNRGWLMDGMDDPVPVEDRCDRIIHWMLAIGPGATDA